ncbi:MAG TPA: hypothetical protein VJH03_09535 [Blastocatellia bacterium]|nr:hypothetical protein [Blastocatellia bacterium]
MIEADGPIQIEDDTEKNILVVREKYNIPGFWKDKKAYLVAGRIIEELSKPIISKRSMPLAIRFPANISQTIEIKLPAPIPISTDSGTVEGEAIRLRYEWERSGSLIRLDYNLTTLRDHVPAEKVARHLEVIDEAQSVLGYEIEQGAEVVNWGAVIPLLGLLAGPVLAVVAVLGVRFVLRRQQRNRFKESLRPLPGASPETAFRISGADGFAHHLETLCRWCTSPRYRGGATLEREGFIYDGRRFTVVRFACEGCGRPHDVYFDGVVPAGESDGG